MPRKFKSRENRPVVFMFWEGESEKMYSKYIRSEFRDIANLNIHAVSGLFNTAVNAFENNPTYRLIKSEIDEVWFFFDTEVEKANQWNDSMKKINLIRKMSKNKVKVKLLMTTACLEYYFVLHFKRIAPAIATAADKDKMLKELRNIVPKYEKGDMQTIFQIAKNYKEAIENGKWTLKCLENELLDFKDEDKRNEVLFQGKYTFTTVHEAIEELLKIQ